MSKRKLLLADDSITIQKVVNLTFADEGIEVFTAGDGDAAMQKFVEIKPDLVMVDVNMPGMDGYRICELIKEDAETKHIPVILMVGSFEPFDEEEARRVGADDYLTKPFQSIRQLVNKVSFLLDAHTEKTPSREVSFNQPSENNIPENQTFKPMSLDNFGDVGLDDDMIQTDQIGSLPTNEEQKFESSSATDRPFFDLPQMTLKKPYDYEVKNNPVKEDVSKTQPLTTAESNKITSSSANVSTEKNSDFADRPSFSKRYIIEEPKVTEQEITKNQTFSESPLDDTNQSAPVEEMQKAYSSARPTELLNFDDFNLLELPMFEDEEVSSDIEQEISTDFGEQFSEMTPEMPKILENAPEKLPATTPVMFETNKAETTIPESAENLQTPTESETKEDFTETSSDKTEGNVETKENSLQPINFSPDLIEAIANKVAEKISARAVREIASEVKPEMVELIIKRMAEEKMKE